MAKRKTKAAKQRQQRAVAVPRNRGLSLSDAGIRYARLLADPCNGDLVAGPFGDGLGGMVARFEKEYVINNSATDTAAFITFEPISCCVRINNAPLTSDTDVITSVSLLTQSWPGYDFLFANASHVRPLAACMQLYWPGSELNRQGICSLGRYPAEFHNDANLTVARLRTQANYIKRTPADCFEIIWRPTEADLEGRELSATPAVFTGSTALVGTATGIPVSTGIRVRIVAVYEWMPDPASGFKNTVVVTPRPHRLADILAFLDRTGDWMSGTATAAGKAMSSLAGGVGSIMALGNGAARLGRAMIAL